MNPPYTSSPTNLADLQYQAYEALQILEEAEEFEPKDAINFLGVRDALGEEFQHMSEQEFEALIIETTADMSPEEIEAFMDSMGEIFGWVKRKVRKAGRWLKKNIGKVGALAGGALGSLIAPGLGTKIGAFLGSKLGNLVGKRSLKLIKKNLRKAKGLLRKAKKATTTAAKKGKKGKKRNNDATKQLMALVKNPQFLKALVSKLMGGKKESVQLQSENGVKEVPFEAFMSTIRYLADKALEEHRAESLSENIPDYLLDEEGQYIVDPSSEAARAEHVLTLLREDFQQTYAEDDDDDPEGGEESWFGRGKEFSEEEGFSEEEAWFEGEEEFLEEDVFLEEEEWEEGEDFLEEGPLSEANESEIQPPVPQHDQLTEWFVQAGWVK